MSTRRLIALLALFLLAFLTVACETTVVHAASNSTVVNAASPAVNADPPASTQLMTQENILAQAAPLATLSNNQVDQNSFISNPDHSSMAFVTKTDGGFRVMTISKNGMTGDAPYASIKNNSLCFLSDNQTVAYVAQVSQPKTNGKAEQVEMLVSGGAAREHYEQISQVQCSRTGNRVAYQALSGGKSFIVVDSFIGDGNGNMAEVTIEMLPAYDSILPNSLRLSQDGTHVAYVGVQDNKQFVVIDNRERMHYDMILGLSDPESVTNTDAKGQIPFNLQYIAVSGGTVYTVSESVQ